MSRFARPSSAQSPTTTASTINSKLNRLQSPPQEWSEFPLALVRVPGKSDLSREEILNVIHAPPAIRMRSGSPVIDRFGNRLNTRILPSRKWVQPPQQAQRTPALGPKLLPGWVSPVSPSSTASIARTLSPLSPTSTTSTPSRSNPPSPEVRPRRTQNNQSLSSNM